MVRILTLFLLAGRMAFGQSGIGETTAIFSYAPIPLHPGRNLAAEVTHLSTPQGLSNSTINDILQDRQGFLWIATEDGLNRYDGYTFKVYKHDPHDATSLSSSTIYSLYEDRDGMLWVGTWYGLNRFNRHDETFTRYVPDYDDPHRLAGPVISDLVEDRDGRFWVSTSGEGPPGALHLFDREAGWFTRYRPHWLHGEKEATYWINAMAVDSAGYLWIGTSVGVDRFDPDTRRFLDHLLDGIWVTRVYCDPSGTIWVCGDGLFRISPDASSVTTYRHNDAVRGSLSHNFVKAFYMDREGNGWVGTGAGVDVLDVGAEIFRFVPITPRSGQVNSHSVNVLFEDRTGVLWVGTRNNGLLRYDRKPRRFSHYLPDPTDPARNDIQTLYEGRSGRIWAGLRTGGVLRFDPDEESFQFIKGENKQAPDLLQDAVEAILEDHRGVVWFGGIKHGLYAWHPQTRLLKQYRHVPGRPNSLSHDRVFSIYEDRQGTLWICTPDGLNRFNRETETFDRFKVYPGKVDQRNTVFQVHEDRSGTLWVAMTGGVYIFDRRSETFQQIQSHVPYPAFFNSYVREDPWGNIWVNSERFGMLLVDRATAVMTQYRISMQGLDTDLQNGITAVQPDSAGTLWLGSFLGLHRFDPRLRRYLAHYYEREGLPSNYITDLAFDNSGKLWILTARGLTRFDPHAPPGMQFSNFTVHHGILNNTKESPFITRLLKTRNGHIYWGGVNGLYRFYPEVQQTNPVPPQVQLTDLRIFEKPVRLDSALSVVKVLHLRHDQNFFTLSFTALDFSKPQLNQYAYRLEGFDREWIYSGTRREAHYTNVPPGEYRFQVRASNNDGVWNEEGASVHIIIAPPWWRTGWAYASYAVLFILALYGLRRFELNRVHLHHELRRRAFEARKLQEMDELKSRFFANVSHEFRTPLTLILGPLEMLLAQARDREIKQALRLMRRNALRLQQLINQLLDLSKLQSGKMALHARRTDAVAFVRTLVMSFASLAERKRIRLSFTSPKEPIFIYADCDKLEKILSNLIFNALKFTPERGNVRVSVRRNGNASQELVEMVVQDSGPGIAREQMDKIFDRFYQVDDSGTRSQEGTGIGLALAKELVELHGGTIEVESEPGRGAVFVVRLPLGKEHLQSHEIVEEEATDAETMMPEEDHGKIEEVDTCRAIPKDAPLVLVVEDNADVRRYMRSRLQAVYRIIEAEDGLVGFQRAVAEIPDLVISDVMMPGMDGFALCHRLKTDPRTSHIPVILLTARASGESKIEGLQTGADDYVTKPFDAKELQVRVKNLIEQRRRLRERFQREFILQPGTIDVTSADDRFLCRAREIVEAHIDDPDFTVERFTREIGMSPMQLHRKLRALTGQSAGRFIRMVRLKRAAALLAGGHGNVAEIAFAVGFNNPSYFAARFRELFGVAPKVYARRGVQSNKEKNASAGTR